MSTTESFYSPERTNATFDRAAMLTQKNCSALTEFLKLSLYVFLIASFYFYARFSVYFTVSTTAMPLLLSRDLHVRLLRVGQ